MYKRSSRLFIACSLGSLLFATAARGDEWATAKTLCEANPACKYEQGLAAGTGLFTISTASGPKFIRCTDGEGCKRMYPKGRAVAVADLPAAFSSR